MNIEHLPVVAAFVVSFALTRYLASPRAVLRILDRPGERSLHARPTPRTGGLAVAAGIALALAWIVATDPAGGSGGLRAMSIGALMVAAVSFVDDWTGLSPLPRLLVHLAAAGVLVAGPWLPLRFDLAVVEPAVPAWLGAALALLFTVWMVNLYNFMDGMDGFAGGMAAIGFGTLAIVGAAQGNAPFALVNGAIAASALGFLVWNFPPARIFMGDTGASTLGFLAAASLLWANHERLLAFWLGLLIFSPFIVDATATLVRRALAGEKVWEPHRRHFYQRLVRLGWGHRRTVLLEYLIMLAASATALLLSRQPVETTGTLVLLAWGAIFVSLGLGIASAERGAGERDRR